MPKYLSDGHVSLVKRSDEFHCQAVSGSLDESHDLFVRSPLHVLVDDAHDEVALLHAAGLQTSDTSVKTFCGAKLETSPLNALAKSLVALY